MLRVGRLGHQVLGVDLLDLVEAVVGVEVEAAGPEAARSTMSAAARRASGGASGGGACCSFFARLAQLGLEVGPRLGGLGRRRRRRPRGRASAGRVAPASPLGLGTRVSRGLGSSGVKNQKIPGRRRPIACAGAFRPPRRAGSSCTQSVRRLAQDKVKPRARAIDKEGAYPADLFEAFRDAGLLGLCIPAEYGGSGAGILGWPSPSRRWPSTPTPPR